VQLVKQPEKPGQSVFFPNCATLRPTLTCRQPGCINLESSLNSSAGRQALNVSRHSMKTLTFILSLFISKTSISQDNLFSKQVDSMVRIINTDAKQVEHFRWLLGYIEYSGVEKILTKIIYSRKAGPRQIIETFYLKDTMLVFATKQAYSYYFYGDSTVLLGKYYFNNNILKNYSLYHGEEENDKTKIPDAIFSKYNKAKSIIYQHQKKKNGG
jgi:hypothetical protein